MKVPIHNAAVKFQAGLFYLALCLVSHLAGALRHAGSWVAGARAQGHNLQTSFFIG